MMKKNRNKILKYVLTPLVMVLFYSAPHVTGAEKVIQKLEIKALPEKKDSLYAVGEEFRFEIKAHGVAFPAKLYYSLARPDGNNINKTIKDFRGQISIPCVMKKPGFALLSVTLTDAAGKTVRARYGAGAEPEKIRFPDSRPGDFESFWKKNAEECLKGPFKVKQFPCDDKPGSKVVCHGFEINDFKGGPVTGYIAIPNVAKKKSLSAIAFFHGAGVRDAHRDIVEGIAKQYNVICMDVGAHGLPLAKGKDYYTNLLNTSLKNYQYTGKEDRTKSYFFNMFRRDLRAMGYLMSLPEWNGKKLVVCGGSQGGGQVLFIAAMVPQVTLVNASVPALCGHNGYAAGYRNGWPQWVDRKDYNKKGSPAAIAASYFDMVNFAPMIKAKAVFTVGLIDPVCPADSVYAAYNMLGGNDKIIFNGPQMSHATTPEISKGIWRIIKEHIK